VLKKFRRWCLDKLVLRPSKDPIDFGQKKEFKIPCGYHHLQGFSFIHGPGSEHLPGESSGDNDSSQAKDQDQDPNPDLLVIKWPGNAGRAENSGQHPAMAWPEKKVELWTINPFGYGGSSRTASLLHLPEMATSVLQFAFRTRPGVPVLLLGNSIGCATALHQAALYKPWVDSGQEISSLLVGLLLVNPPPLVQLIPGHYHRFYYGPVTRWLAGGVPEAADSVVQAGRVSCRCFLLQCSEDQIVPPVYQNLIFDAAGGEKMKWIFNDSDHNSLPDLQPGSKYLSDLRDFFNGL